MVDAIAAYRRGNNAGRGWAPNSDTVDEAVSDYLADGGELVLSRRTSDEVVVVRAASGKLIAVGGDAGGAQAWAVVIDDAVQP
jgi:hypothetical protein